MIYGNIPRPHVWIMNKLLSALYASFYRGERTVLAVFQVWITENSSAHTNCLFMPVSSVDAVKLYQTVIRGKVIMHPLGAASYQAVFLKSFISPKAVV